MAEAQAALLDAAEARLAGPAQRLARTGRVEREVVTACADADLLVLGQDGDHTGLGAAQPRARHPVRARPRALPGAAGLAGRAAEPGHPARATARGRPAARTTRATPTAPVDRLAGSVRATDS